MECKNNIKSFQIRFEEQICAPSANALPLSVLLRYASCPLQSGLDQKSLRYYLGLQDAASALFK